RSWHYSHNRMRWPCLSGTAVRKRTKRSTTALRHFCFSWAVSGADDTSPCCEQFNVLRIGSKHPTSVPHPKPGRCRGRGQFHWGETIPARRRIQDLSGYILNHVFPRQHSVSFQQYRCEGLSAGNFRLWLPMPTDLQQLRL